jgi:hypothetical protein
MPGRVSDQYIHGMHRRFSGTYRRTGKPISRRKQGRGRYIRRNQERFRATSSALTTPLRAETITTWSSRRRLYYPARSLRASWMTRLPPIGKPLQRPCAPFREALQRRQSNRTTADDRQARNAPACPRREAACQWCAAASSGWADARRGLARHFSADGLLRCSSSPRRQHCPGRPTPPQACAEGGHRACAAARVRPRARIGPSVPRGRGSSALRDGTRSRGTKPRRRCSGSDPFMIAGMLPLAGATTMAHND